MDSLHGEFELEQGNGGERCEYLLEKGIETYLVLAPDKKVPNGLNGNVSFSTLSKPYDIFFNCLILADIFPQTPGTLLKNDSNQLINTTETNGNIASPQSTPTDTKQEVNSDKCLYSLSSPNFRTFFAQGYSTLYGNVSFLISLFLFSPMTLEQ